MTAIIRHVCRVLADPGGEQATTWDLAVVGHRGGGASNVRGKINALARLSESRCSRPDHGLAPAELGRCDIDNFLNQLGNLE